MIKGLYLELKERYPPNKSLPGRLIHLVGRLINAVRKSIHIIRRIHYFLRRIVGYPQRIRFKSRVAELAQTDLLLKQETGKLLSRQMVGTVFNRMDIIVRYLAIEEFFGLNDFGWTLYRKMQERRGPFPHSEDNFRALLRYIVEKGFDPHSRIKVDEAQRLIDGSHRMACALYFGEKEVPVEIVPGKFDVRYGIEWFERVGFTPSELEIIQNKKGEIFKKWGLYFAVTLWPPVQDYFDEIEMDLARTYRVISSADYMLTDNFTDVVKMVYAADDIADWKVEKKIKGMMNYPKRIRFLLIEIPEPKFRKKSRNNHDISVTVEEIKAKYRGLYAKQVENYFYDLIIHIGDNFHHNQRIIGVFEDLNDYMCHHPCPRRLEGHST